MNLWIWVTIVIGVLVGLLAWFVVISRKGRALRRSQPLLPVVRHAFLEWSNAGSKRREEIVPPFYLGKSPKSNVVLPDALVDFELCIFYHNLRFAIQSLNGARQLLVNGQEMMAGYLRDGDTLRIAEHTFVFRCY